MKTFSDLNFKAHPNGPGTQAILFFPNGYGVSVIAGSIFYTNCEEPYELAVLLGGEKKPSLTYATPITNDVIGYLTEEKVTAIMKDVQNLPSTV